MSVLQIFRGDDFLEEVVLSRAVMGLGRHPQNDIVLDDRSLSRFHARVERRGDRFVVVDCGAQNGVHVNGSRVNGESDLTPGDRITLGRYVAVFDSLSRGATPPKYDLNKEVPKRKNGIDAEIEALEVDVDLALDPAPAKKNGAAVAASAQEPTLVLLFNGMEVSRHPIPKDGLTVGRSKQSDVVISLLGLSRKHAKIARNRDNITVEDLGSQNGTWVNNQRISGQKALKHGDLLNFYDYAVLFLEDGDVEVGFPGPMFTPPPDDASVDDLSNKETNRSGTAPASSKSRPPTAKSPVPLADSQLSPSKGSKKLEVKNGFHPPQSASELVDLGEGSFLGDEFEEEASAKDSDRKGDPQSSSLLDEEPLEPSKITSDKTNATDVVPDLDLPSDVKNGLDAGGFEGVAGTEGDQQKFEDKTSSAVHARGHAWPSDSEVLTALSNTPDTMIVTIEVNLSGKAYTQMPLSQTVTRVGTDARCELSLPKSSGMNPWHMTLIHVGGAVIMYRAARAARIMLAENDVDMAMLRDGDLIDCGKVRLKIRMK
ncbi:MAG TPA: FHA domain-containing protein [Myxococcota bacterium]